MLLKNESQPRELVPAGLHLAACFSIVDLGSHQSQFGIQRKLLFSFELPNEVRTFEAVPQRMAISKEYTASLGTKANLRKALIGWRGRDFSAQEDEQGFDPYSMLGLACQIQVIHKIAKSTNNPYSDVSGIMVATVAVDKLENPLVKFSWDNYDPIAFGKLPEWIQKKCHESDEHRTGKGVQIAAEQAADPFNQSGAMGQEPEPITDPNQEPLPF